ncbi:hypothetical protein HKD37_20G055776 [Glycine soja]
MSVGSLSSTPTVASYEWVRDDVLKYKSCLTLAASVAALQCKVKLANPEDSCKLACALLEHLNEAPSQLHLNNWAMIGWVSLNRVSKKLFEFDSNVFHYFKDRFFKVLATDVVVDGMPLMFNRDGELCFSFYWQSGPTKFKSYDEDLLTVMETVDKAILEQLPASLDARAILSLPSASDPLAALNGIVGDFPWRPLVK